MADNVSEMAALMEKMKEGKATPEEIKKLNAYLASKNEKLAPIADSGKATAPNVTPKQTVEVQPIAQPAIDDKRRLDLYSKQREGLATETEKAELAADVAKRKARFAELEAKRQKGVLSAEEQKELGALLQSATVPMKAGVDIPIPSKTEAQAAIDAAKAQGAVGYMDPTASTESLTAGGAPVYRDFEQAAAPAAVTPETPPSAPVTPAAKKSAVDDVIAGLKAEGITKDNPTFWDVLQAAAAGWNFQTPAYIEKQKAKQAEAAEIEKLSRTAQLERALQEEKIAAEAGETEKERATRLEIAKIQSGLGGIGAMPGLSKGAQLGLGLMQSMGKGK
jgi:hypothetical protein